MFFESRNINLRSIEPTDIDILYEWENHVALWQLSNTHQPFSKYILKSFIDNSTNDIFVDKSLRLIITNKADIAIGTIDLFDFDPFHLRAGVGVLIADIENRGNGYANESLTLLIKYATEILQLNQLYCNINADNVESIKLFIRNGFEITGNKKEWNKTKEGYLDELFLQLIISKNEKVSSN